MKTKHHPVQWTQDASGKRWYGPHYSLDSATIEGRLPFSTGFAVPPEVLDTIESEVKKPIMSFVRWRV